MSLFSLALGIIGLVGWSYIWISKRYNTGKCWHSQIAIMLFGFMWMSLILADAVQHLEPTSGTIFARIILLVACGLMTPTIRIK